MLVAIDAGHGMLTGGKRTPPLRQDLVINGKVVRKKGDIIHEHEFNRAVALYIGVALKRCGIYYMYTADMIGNSDISLTTRSNRANNAKADIFISCHYNAIGSCASFQTKTRGLLVLRTANCSSKSITLGNYVHDALRHNYDYSFGLGRDIDVSGFTLAVLRQTTMPAILIEYGFMDYEKEAVKMLDPVWQKQLAEDTVKGICKYFGATYKAEEVNPTVPTIQTDLIPGIYRVNVDSLNIRSGPGTSYQVIGSIDDRGSYTITDVSGNWGKVSPKMYDNGWICISKEFCERVEIKQPEPEFKEYLVKIQTGDNSNLNVRVGPGAEYDKTAIVKNGDVFTIVDEAKDKDGSLWGLLKAYRKNRNGWIKLKYTIKK